MEVRMPRCASVVLTVKACFVVNLCKFFSDALDTDAPPGFIEPEEIRDLLDEKFRALGGLLTH